MGGDQEQETNSATARALLQHEKLVRRRYSNTMLDDMLAKDGAALMRRHGARRNLSIIFVRATDNPNKIVRRDFPAALQRATGLRRQAVDGKQSFAHVARTTSDDPDTKPHGGKVGWQHREYRRGTPSQRLPAEVLEAAFELSIGDISAPIRTAEGYYLVWVAGLEPDPDKAVVQRRLLAELAEIYTQEMATKAKIEIVDPGARAAPAGATEDPAPGGSGRGSSSGRGNANRRGR
jgi:hypothetical protein